MDDKKYFIGSSKVKSVVPQSENWVRYELEDGRSGLVRQEQFDSMKRDSAYGDEYVIVYKWSPLTAEILKLALMYDIPIGETNFISKQFEQTMVDNYEKAVSKMFKRSITEHIRISQLDEIIKTTTELIKE